MNINFQSIASQTVSLFKEHVLSSLTDQQKRILVIASLALSCLTLYYAISRFCFKANKLGSSAIDPISSPKISSPKWIYEKDHKVVPSSVLPADYELKKIYSK